jgi:DNA-binding ferritin-like protein
VNPTRPAGSSRPSTVVRRLRPRIDEADKLNRVTQDLFIEVTRALEKARWMWQAQSHNDGAERR